MMEFYNGTYHTAHKEYKCECCGKVIQKGERYSRESGKWNGDFFVRILCVPCRGMLDHYCAEVEQEFIWDDVQEFIRDEHCMKCEKGISDDGCDLWEFNCPIIRAKYGGKSEE
ncbi:hypothetical protein [uncultured Succiniclasticum sp.]|uniref:hypothetical protein n=1 Tax=uncultured Succiniclasticum sp. TaxID=1500547 RepID=UPI0026012540|nr:hypothetical protein [uncultured Succiniclasticum sp.]